MHNITKLMISIALFTLLFGCTNPNPNQTLSPYNSTSITETRSTKETSQTKYFNSESTQTFKDTVIPTTYVLPKSTQTPTKKITIIPSLTYTQQLTPAPTFSLGQFRDHIFDLLRNNAGCKLPCWWGITPGITSWEEAQRIITQMGVKIFDSPKSDGSVLHGLGGAYWQSDDIYMSISFLDQKGIVTNIYIDVEGYYNLSYFRLLWKNYSIETINSTYGPPSRVFVGLSGSEKGEIFYMIVIFYDNLGFVTINRGKALKSDEKGTPMYKVCPTWQDLVWLPDLKLYLQAPDNITPLETMADVTPSDWKTIDEATGITTQDFYNLLLPGNAPACFYTPEGMWK